MYSGWAQFAGVEIINSSRATTYAATAGLDGVACDDCPTLADGLGERQYTDPIVDVAPWWDPTHPESGRFYGFAALSVDGLDAGTGARGVIDLPGDGQSLGRVRRGAREITYTVLGIAEDECAMSYGLGWLASVLRGAACASCGGDELCLFTCCPTTYAEGTASLRHLYNVGLVGGPAVTNRHYLEPDTCNGALAAQVTFTLVAGLPWFYTDPAMFTAPPFVRASGIIDQPYCPPGVDCADDPACPPLPRRPTVPVPADTCGCKLASNALRSLVTVPAAAASQWLETVPVIDVFTGSAAITCLRLRFYANPGTAPCEVLTTEQCAFCDELALAYVPPRARLLIDGRTRTTSIDCSALGGSPDPTAPRLTGGPGRQYTWPVFDCPGQVCVEVLANQVASNAWVRVGISLRSDAI